MSSTDSLKQSIHLMQVKIDSLERIAIKNEIGAGFFSDVLAGQLWLFSAFLAALALINWGFIASAFSDHKKIVNQSAIALINTHLNKNEELLSDTRKHLKIAMINSSRSMFFHARTLDNEAAKFHWSIFTLKDYLDIEDAEESKLIIWLNHSLTHIKKVDIGNGTIQRNIKEYITVLDRLEGHISSAISSKAREIKKDALHKCYTKDESQT